MPPSASEAVQPRPQQRAGGQQQQAGIGQTIKGIIRMAVFWYFAMKFFSPKKPPAEPSQLMSNLFPKGARLDMWLYLSVHEKFNDYGNEESLIWHETNIPYAVWGPQSSRSFSLMYSPSEALKHNGSLYAHVFFARSGYPPDPNDPEYQPLYAFQRTYPVVAYLPKSKLDKKRSLLSDSKSAEKDELASEVFDKNSVDDEDSGPTEWVSYWKPNITINLVDDFNRYPHNAIPPNIADYINVEPSTMNYYPTIFFNEFWLLRDKLIPINATITKLPLNLEVAPISTTKWQLFLQIEQSFQIHRSYGSMLEGEADELKRVFLEGNPYLLVITMVVSVLHSVFDFLAFKNDIQFWNKNKSMEGLSAKSVVLNFACQLIVFLYLLDNETSWMILASSGVGCCIEFWKIGKAMHIEIDRSRWIPLLRFRDRESYTNNKTKEYDDIAMKYLSIHHDVSTTVHQLQTKVSCSFALRQMTYKFLNTIIDDLFAFVIKMQTLHRLSVFRDGNVKLMEVIFLAQPHIVSADLERTA